MSAGCNPVWGVTTPVWDSRTNEATPPRAPLHTNAVSTTRSALIPSNRTMPGSSAAARMANPVLERRRYTPSAVTAITVTRIVAML